MLAINPPFDHLAGFPAVTVITRSPAKNLLWKAVQNRIIEP
jgi:hypothetical protein